MSNPNNRKKVLAGFGVFAVAVVAAVLIWQPAYRNEEASGAIGAVEKHRAPQITPSDVILGDEQTRTQQAVLWGDFFQNATKLQSISAAYANAAASRENVANVEAAQLASELQNQFAAKMNVALQAMEMNAKQAGNNEMAAKASQLLGQLAANEQLSAKAMHQLSSAFSEAAAQAKLAQKGVGAATAELGMAVSELANNGELAAAKLQAATSELAAAKLNAVDLENQAEYFSRIQAAAASLESASLAASGKAQLASEELAQAANRLQAAALENIEEQMAANISMASAFSELQGKLAASREQLAAAACCGSRLAAFEQALSAASAQFQSHAASMIQAELASMETFAASRQQYAKLGAQHLEAKMVGAAAVDNKVFAILANTDELQQAAAKLNASLRNAELANALANEEQMAARLNAFEARLQAKAN